MITGIIESRGVVEIKDIQGGFYHLRFIEPNDKLKMPDTFKQMPYGYDGYQVYLPLEVVERVICKCFPSIEFISDSD